WVDLTFALQTFRRELIEPGEGDPKGKTDPCSDQKPTRRPFRCADRRPQLGDSLRERPHSAEIKNRSANDIAPLQLGEKVARIHPFPIWAAPRVESKGRITARGVVSFLKVNEAEAQAEIFYGPFYGRAKFGCKTVQLCATHCESEIANCLASATICKSVKRCATR